MSISGHCDVVCTVHAMAWASTDDGIAPLPLALPRPSEVTHTRWQLRHFFHSSRRAAACVFLNILTSNPSVQRSHVKKFPPTAIPGGIFMLLLPCVNFIYSTAGKEREWTVHGDSGWHGDFGIYLSFHLSVVEQIPQTGI